MGRLKMEYAALSSVQVNRAKQHAILSACWGSLSAGLINDSPIVMIMAEKMNAGPALTLMTTSLISLAYSIMLLPMGYIAAKLGYGRTIKQCSFLGFLIILLVCFSPSFGGWGPAVMLMAIAAYGITMSAYNAAWFPFIDNFLPKDQRHSFFGTMRFCWQGCSVCFFFVCGLLIGKSPSMFALQVVVFVSALGLLGRIYHVSKVPQPNRKPEEVKFRIGLTDAVRNKALSGYSAYLCFLYLFCFATQPVAFVYIKNGLEIPANIVVIISALALTGSIIGFLVSGILINAIRSRKVIVISHLTFVFINISMFFINGNSFFHIALITILLFINAFMLSMVSITTTSEMLTLATPWNRAMSMAYCGSFYSLGSGCARLISSLILGSGMLAPLWTYKSFTFTNFQTLFLFNSAALLFACLLLVMVPAVFPKGKYRYTI